MRSFSLIKTNVGLTSNVKITLDSNGNLFLDSINSNAILTDSKFKRNSFTIYDDFESILKNFYKELSNENAFFVKNEDDSDVMYSTFDKQIDDIYIAGAQDITDNKFYSEDFEYFAPLYISKSGLPKYFAIFRLDGTGTLNLTRENFRSQFLNKLKCVKVVDLTTNTQIGQWLYNNIINNSLFPACGFEIDFRNLNFSHWNGIDYTKGLWTKTPYYFDDVLDYENTFHDLEKFIYDGFRNNNIIYPNILNLNFLFDDQPATPTSLRNWSINRYAGFYLDDMIYSKSVTTYLSSVVVPDCEILPGNILTSTFNRPFTDETLKQNRIFIEIEGFLYEVVNVPVNIAGFETNRWIIKSDKDLTGKQSLINKNVIIIDSNNKISYLNGQPFIIEDWNTADVWLIKIGDKFHTLQYTEGNYYIYSDYGFSAGSGTLNYYINYPDPAYNTTIDMTTGNYWTGSNVNQIYGSNSPTSFPIYKLQFTEIKQFDETLVETKFANHQYEKQNEVIQTDEPKMHMTDLSNNSFPKAKVDFAINNLVTNIPSASHYTANHETFRVVQNQNNSFDLNKLWLKNAEHAKWGFKNSISANDYPYYLNNSFVAEVHNKTADSFLFYPSRKDRNLDYFYTINSSTSSWHYHSLHIEEIVDNTIVTDYSFDVYQYLNLNYDYFSLFFDRKIFRNNSTIIENVDKFSYFNSGDTDIPNITLFQGLKVNIYDVLSVKLNNGLISNINCANNNTYDDYKFSILLSKNSWTIESDTSNLNQISITTSNNTLEWKIVDNWKLEKQYDLGEIVNYCEILYVATTNSNINNPNYNPANSSDWTYSSINTIWFSPTETYTSYSGIFATLSNIVYNSGEYYYNNGAFFGPINTFYVPGTIYATGSVVIYQNSVWESTTYPNIVQPNANSIWRDSSNTPYNYWKKIDFKDSFGLPTTQWTLINLWSSLEVYFPGNLVVHSNILYYCNSITTIGVTPDSSLDWTRLYSIIPDTNYIYKETIENNNLIFNNNRYYICTSNTGGSTLDNGIYIFVNKTFKNILINIYVNDNTLENLSNVERDYLYNDLYTNLTANNFINAINDVQNNYGFTNKIKYIIFDKTASKIYDFSQVNSFVNLTTFIKIDRPDVLNTRIESLNVDAVSLAPNQIKPTLTLDNGSITSISQRNNYNKIPLAANIQQVKVDAKIVPNYSSLTNRVFNSIYRHSGYYDPIFITIDLFKKGLTYSTNTIFDDGLTNFGIAKELIISKVNRNGNQLKLRNDSNLKSIYPMLDEFGFSTRDFFIFKSTWDYEYFTECYPIMTIEPAKIVDSPVIYNPISVSPKYLA